MNLAVRYMQDLGIRYYMAFRPDVVAQADQNPELTPLRQVGPWTVYEVADSQLVVPLQTNPVVVKGHDAGTLPLGIGAKRDRWLELGTSWFQHPEDWAALPAANGPADWQRISVAPMAEQVDGKSVVQETDDRHLARVQPVETIDTSTLAPATVSDVVQTDDSISFNVDKVGVPVLVKVSYFPNWKVSGAEGPYRVAPNFMVVVPTSNHVTLTYGTSQIEYLGYLLTLIGIVGVIVLWRKGPVSYAPASTGPVVWEDGELRWHEEPPLPLPEPEPEKDITADHERFEVLADQVFGPPQGEPEPALELDPRGTGAAAAPQPAPDRERLRGTEGAGQLSVAKRAMVTGDGIKPVH